MFLVAYSYMNMLLRIIIRDITDRLPAIVLGNRIVVLSDITQTILDLFECNAAVRRIGSRADDLIAFPHGKVELFIRKILILKGLCS